MKIRILKYSRHLKIEEEIKVIYLILTFEESGKIPLFYIIKKFKNFDYFNLKLNALYKNIRKIITLF